jgi:hypothetical protein
VNLVWSKKLSGLIVVRQEAAQSLSCSALCHRWNPAVVELLQRAEHFLYLNGFSLDGTARRTPLPLFSLMEDSTNRINLDKHSSFTDRTQLSAQTPRS